MALLNDKIKEQLRPILAELDQPVQVLLFTQGEGNAIECTTCSEARQLVEEVAGLSDKVRVDVRDLVGDADMAASYGIDKIPAAAILRDGTQPKDYGIRLYGIPSGYEFGSFIEDLRLVSKGEPELSPQTLQEIGKLDKDVHIQVYVTPT